MRPGARVSILNADTIVVADVLRQQEIERAMTINLFELGVRRQLTPLTVVSLGAGAGFGPESPRYRLTMACQHSF